MISSLRGPQNRSSSQHDHPVKPVLISLTKIHKGFVLMAIGFALMKIPVQMHDVLKMMGLPETAKESIEPLSEVQMQFPLNQMPAGAHG